MRRILSKRASAGQRGRCAAKKSGQKISENKSGTSHAAQRRRREDWGQAPAFTPLV